MRRVKGKRYSIVAEMILSELDNPEFCEGYFEVGFYLEANITLWHVRRESGITQEQLAEKLGVSTRTIRRMERETDGNITLKRFYEWVKACGKVAREIQVATLDELVTEERAEREEEVRVFYERDHIPGMVNWRNK